MYQCLCNKISIKIIIPSIIVLLTVFSSYGVTKYSQNLQIALLNLEKIPLSYRIYFNISAGFAMFVPIIVFIFLFSTIYLMMYYFFDEMISKRKLYISIGTCFLPVLIYQYFFWCNLIYYCDYNTIKTVDDFLNVSFLFGLKLEDFEIISNFCWGILYLGVFFYLYFSGKPFFKALASITIPTLLVMLIYYIIK